MQIQIKMFSAKFTKTYKFLKFHFTRCCSFLKRFIAWKSCTELIVILGVPITALGVWLQYYQYTNNSYIRLQSAINLSWSIIERANEKEYDIGQNMALDHLARANMLTGRIRLINSELTTLNWRPPHVGENYVLNNSIFCGTRIHFAYLIGSDFQESVFNNGSISGIYNKANFRGAQFIGTTILTAQFNKTNMTMANFNYSGIMGASFKNANLEGATFNGSRFIPVKESEEILNKKPLNIDYFSKSIPHSDATFKWLKSAEKGHAPPKSNSKVIKTNFKGANVKYVDFRNANLTATNLSQEQINSACINKKTILPHNIKFEVECDLEFIEKRRKVIRSHLQDSSIHKSCISQKSKKLS